MKWLTISIVPIFLTCLCVVSHNYQVGCNINKPKTCSMDVMSSIGSVKDEKAGSEQILDNFTETHVTDQDYILINKNIIIWIP